MCNSKAYCEIKIKNLRIRLREEKRENLVIHLEAFGDFVHSISLSSSFFLPD